jgi:hypothetical protein
VGGGGGGGEQYVSRKTAQKDISVASGVRDSLLGTFLAVLLRVAARIASKGSSFGPTTASISP